LWSKSSPLHKTKNCVSLHRKINALMNSKDFGESIRKIIADGFTPEGLQKLDHYAELFINGRLVYKRFSPFEQHGCSEGGATHVIASLLAGAENQADREIAR